MSSTAVKSPKYFLHSPLKRRLDVIRTPTLQTLYSSSSPEAGGLKKKRIVNPLRPVLKGITGFSLTALRQTLRTLTGLSLSKFVGRLLKPMVRVWPLSVRAFLQPFLVLYYWPLLFVRALVMKKGYPLSSEKVLKAVENLVVEEEYVPISIDYDLSVDVMKLPSADEFEKRVEGIGVEKEKREEEDEVKVEETAKAEEEKAPLAEVKEEKEVAEKVEEVVVAEEKAPATTLFKPDIQQLTGKWKLYVTPEFKTEYGAYLKSLSQPQIVINVALGLVGFTTEETQHVVDSGALQVIGRNPRGDWDRVLELTGEDSDGVDVETADSEIVKAQSWWSDDNVHNSWLRNTKKYGGGDFSSKRYIDSEGFYICESTFHPSKQGRSKANIKWKFEKVV
ncbi:hypothetical protein TrCOL_g252 [Triparma columacea]|uniref:Uncharacterized protein n=1 Tax=Triparma columacea TaxID=722753 RepID=A0A9W7L3W6_9STRA|nr:hypothetical protein TrCOL_g252 [Triparma columacea]